MSKIPSAQVIESLAQLSSEGAKKKMLDILKLLKEEYQESNNDKRIEIINLIKKLSSNFPEEVLGFVRIIVDDRNTKPPVKYKQPFPWEGKSHEDVLLSTVEILSYINLQYNYLEKVYDLLRRIYYFNPDTDKQSKVKKRVLEMLREMSNYRMFADQNLKSWKYQKEYKHQQLLLKEVESMLKKSEKKYFEITKPILEKLLNTEMEGRYSDEDKLTLQFSQVDPNDSVKTIRRNVIDILLNLIEVFNSDQAKQVEVLDILSQGTQTPTRGGYSDDLESLVVSDSKYILKKLVGIIPKIKYYSTVYRISTLGIWCKRRYKKKLEKEVECLQVKINSDKFYTKYYKVLVYMFTDEDDFEDSWEEREKKQKKRIQKLLETISPNKAMDIQTNLNRVVENILEEEATIQVQDFLYKLGKFKSETAKIIVKNTHVEEPLHEYLFLLIRGLKEANENDFTSNILNDWLEREGKDYLMMIPKVFSGINIEKVNGKDIEILVKLSEKKEFIEASKRDSFFDYSLCRAICQTFQINTIKSQKIIRTILARSESINIQHLLDILGLNAYRERLSINSFNKKTQKSLKEALVLMDEITSDAEEILYELEILNNGTIYKVFTERIKREKSLKKGKKASYLSSRYNAVPYRFTKLINLKKEKKLFINILESIYDNWALSKDHIFRWNSKDFLRAIAPDITKEVKELLLKKLKKEKKEDALAVLSISKGYIGKKDLYDICFEVVKLFGSHKDIKGSVKEAIYSTGGVSGKDGFVKACEAKRKMMEEWSRKRDDKVKDFSKEAINDLNKIITERKKRMELNEALMKS